LRGCPVAAAEDVLAGGGEIMGRAGFHVEDPERETIRSRNGLDVAAMSTVFTGVPHVDRSALDAGDLLGDPVGVEEFPIADDVDIAIFVRPVERWRAACRSGASQASTSMTSSM
jgi:hypothetical protein